MAYPTLDAIRTGYLNLELGLSADSDASFGSETARNFYIQNAIRRLWPEVGKLTSEQLTIVANDQTYNLTTVEDVERIEIFLSGNDQVLAATVRSWQVLRDESTEVPVNRLIIPALQVGSVLRVIGYVPYAVPTSSPPSSSGAVDFPTRVGWVVSAGARVEAYRAKVNSFANYEQFANENRSNVLTPPEILELLRQAEREFQQGKASIRRDFAAPHRARVQTR